MTGQNAASFESIATGSNVNLFHHRTTKFKSTMIKVFLTGGFDSGVEERAILPAVLERGSRGYPSLRALSQKLEHLYGGKLGLDTFKLGERQIFVAMLDLVNERLLPGSARVFDEGAGLFRDVLMNPRESQGAFLPDVFDVEKHNLERYIESQINDKATYANIRLVEEMFHGQPFGLFHWGRLDKVRELDPAATYRFYKEFLRSAPADVYVLGDISSDAALSLCERIFGGLERGPVAALPEPGEAGEAGGEIVIEELPVEQSKLAMGFNVNVVCSDELYYALFYYNAILGGGSFSKLFKTVRERESLAYYAGSSFERHKGFLRVTAGIHRDHLDRVLEIVRTQMDGIASGRITGEEFTSARSALQSGLRAVRDSAGQFIDYHMTARMTGRETRIDRIAERVARVQPQHVAAAAALVEPGLTFFLKGTAG